jgi:predicted alpha/beta hydrolase
MSPTGAAGQPIEFLAEDGERLQGSLFEPASQPLGQVLVAGGLAIPQRFYAPFAAWLAARGQRVMTFDPRGMGRSRRPEHRASLRDLQADVLTWARQDFAAAVRWLADSAAGQPVTLVGHSLGMHHAAMTDAATQARIARAVSVAAGSGYWRDWAASSRRKAPLMLHLAAPLLTPLFGYFPGRRLRMVGDLPGPAMRQWSAWCRHPGFAWGAEPALVLPSLLSARFPIDAFGFTDDEAMTEDCTSKLLQAMPNAPSALRILSPGELGLTAIGHLGAFRPEAAAALWPVFEAALHAKD